MFNLIKFYSLNFQGSQSLYIFANEKKRSLMFESGIIALIFCLIFLFSGLNIIAGIITAICILNLILILYKLNRAKFYLMKQTPKYQAQEEVGKFIYAWQALQKVLISRKMSTSELDNWESYFMNMLKKERSVLGVVRAREELKKLARNNFDYQIDDPTSIMLDQYMQKNFAKDVLKYYKEFMPLLMSGQISLVTAEAASRYSETIAEASSSAGPLQPVAAQLRTLGLSANTKNPEVIKKRYLELVKLYHPDNSKQATSDQLREITEAYQIIRDFIKK